MLKIFLIEFFFKVFRKKYLIGTVFVPFVVRILADLEYHAPNARILKIFCVIFLLQPLQKGEHAIFDTHS